MSLTAAQVWYVARVYPERVTDAEAREAYEKECETDSDRSYWEAAAKVLSEIGGKSPVIEAAEDEVERLKQSVMEHSEQLREQTDRATAAEDEVERLRAVVDVDEHRHGLDIRRRPCLTF